MSKIPWFFHSSDARNAPAFLEIRAEYGWEGYGVAWAILERIAAGPLRTWPMNDLREDTIAMGLERGLMLKVLKMLQQFKLVATKEIRDEEFRMNFYHLYSPMLEKQLQNKQLQFMARSFEPREKTARPGIPRDIRAQVLATGCCAYCGATEELQVDHIYPYSKGGAHTIENFQPLCRPCNSAKRDKTEEEYFALIGRTNG